MKRVQVNSRTSDTNVSLTYPTLDPNKLYTLTVEKLTVPAFDSLILNNTLFTVERRLRNGVSLTGAHHALPLPEEFTTFTPQNVRTVSQLVYQMNIFFREMCMRLATVVIPYNNAQHQFAIPVAFTRQIVDWFTGLNNADPIETALQAVFRPDGKLGFRFSVDGLKLFVLKLTDEGKRIFGRTQRYLALDSQGLFEENYEILNHPVVADGSFAIEDLPAAVTESYIFFCDNSMFSHVNYRHELVLKTSLPLETHVECDTDHSFYRHQLASYKFPDPNTSMRYDGTVHRELVETTQTRYTFEKSLRTHNAFKITGTSLQNFTLYLISRSYEYDGKRYKQTEKPYSLHEDTFYTVQFALRPVQ